MKKSNRKGFTIVELVIVIAVIAILAAVLIPTFSNLIKKANESSDIQAVREMNTFLTAEAILDGVDSIFDVYDIFEESGFKVENYSPLVSGNEFYYDVKLNQILYVNADGVILFPKENKGKTQADLGHTWLSLSMSITPTAPESENFVLDAETKVMTATVNTAGEYAYVIEQYNSAEAGTALNLTVNGVVDMKGASVEIAKAKGAVTITGVNGATLKNITTNKFYSESIDSAGNLSSYNAAALIVEAGGAVEISNITLENVNVKGVFAGNMAFLVANAGSNAIVIENVNIKDSTLIGHRNMGSYVGYFGLTVTIKGTNTLENVQVLTVGGRSGLLAGRGMDSGSKVVLFKDEQDNYATVTWDEATKLDIYTDSAVSKQEVLTDTNYTAAGCGEDDSILNCSTFIKSVKTINGGVDKYAVYGFEKDALWLANGVGSDMNHGLKAYKTIDEMKSVS